MDERLETDWNFVRRNYLPNVSQVNLNLLQTQKDILINCHHSEVNYHALNRHIVAYFIRASNLLQRAIK